MTSRLDDELARIGVRPGVMSDLPPCILKHYATGGGDVAGQLRADIAGLRRHRIVFLHGYEPNVGYRVRVAYGKPPRLTVSEPRSTIRSPDCFGRRPVAVIPEVHR